MVRPYTEIREELPVVDDSNYDQSVGQLDLVLTYLWRVHGVDYYACYELGATEFGQRSTACRLLRGPKPHDSTGGADAEMRDASSDAAAEGKEVQAAAAVPAGGEDEGAVEARWAKRIADGDPLEARCQRQLVEDRVNAWVEEQITRHSDQKWVFV